MSDGKGVFMKCLVLGGNGFIGSHLVDRLLAEDHQVRVFDRQEERYRSPLNTVDYRYGDFGNHIGGMSRAFAAAILAPLISPSPTTPADAQADSPHPGG